MMYYRQFRQGVNDNNYKLIPINVSVDDFITTTEKDSYVSIYEYNEEQYQKFKSTGSVSGIRDVTTTRLVFDFDSKDNLPLALDDTVKVCNKLIKELNISAKDIEITFSGQKGFGVQVNTTNRLTVEQFKNITNYFAEGLTTFDKVVSDANRIIRLPYTKHQTSGLYKIPLTLEILNSCTVDDIKNAAKSLDNVTEDMWSEFRYNPIVLPSKLLTTQTKPKVKEGDKDTLSKIDFTHKPKGWSNCKWAMSQGYEIKSGNREIKLTTIVATCKALNYTAEQAYYTAKNAYEKGVEYYGGDDFNKKELWENIVEKSVYSPNWKGGSYSCRDGKTPWLEELCESLGANKCKHNDIPIVTTSEVFSLFKNYAENFEKNVLRSGIESLDKKCKLLVGTSNGILAPPGCGKTSLVLDILNYNSKQRNHSILFSYDMYHSALYARMIQKHTGLEQDDIFNIFKNNKKEAERIRQIIEDEYKYVHFCFKSGQSADEIQETILDLEQSMGDKIKLCAVDYNELVLANSSDPTQASAETAQRMRQIANDTSTCMLQLLQPSKVYSNPTDEISTYQGAKGSGAIAQSLSLMLSLSRPGFHPRHPEQDKFLTINALKHRQGGLFTIDLGWEGLRGAIRELAEEEIQELQQLRDEKKLEADNGFG